MNAYRPALISPRWRTAAVVVLLLWTAGLAVCMAHCALGTVRFSSVQLGCSSSSDGSTACHGNDAGDTNKSQPGSAAVCYTLKHLFADGQQVVLKVPELSLFDTAFFLEALATGTQPAARVNLRQHHLWEWVFTPEVSLGPAFRSLAPPLAS